MENIERLQLILTGITTVVVIGILIYRKKKYK